MHRLLAVLLLAVLPLAVPGTSAAALTPTTTTAVVASGYASDRVPVDITVVAADGLPVAGVPVLLERRNGRSWDAVGSPVTGEDGLARRRVWLKRDPARNVFRVSFAGDETRAGSSSGPVAATLLRHPTTLTLDGPARVVDESTVRLTARWRTSAGAAVNGAVHVRRRQGGTWATVRTLRTGSDGVVSFTVGPRVDTAWKVHGPRLAWAEWDVSPRHDLDNVPRIAPVSLPAGAPRPSVALPAQRRAVGAGANARVTRIPDAVWSDMVGRSWHRGCPVGRRGLRLVRLNYWGFDGYRRRGELVVATGVTQQVVRAFSALHRKRLPLRSMYRVDRFGWSDRLNGADDYRSMAADNTSAFNCRDVVGRPGRVSPHSYGRSVDINPWENPYRSSSGWVPSSWWVSRSHPKVAWRDRSHAVVETMSGAGFAWTYGVDDAHHFDARTWSGRVLLRGVCDAVVCR
jgi:hypothetical protein